MIKVVISGYGKMGHMVEKELQSRGIELVDASEDITATPKDVAKECVCIDFTTPEAFRANFQFIARNFKAAVIGTTGWNDIKADVIKAFTDAGTPMVYASNFSLGVNALYLAITKASEILKGAGYTLRLRKSIISTSWTPPPERQNQWENLWKNALERSRRLLPSVKAKSPESTLSPSLPAVTN